MRNHTQPIYAINVTMSVWRQEGTDHSQSGSGMSLLEKRAHRGRLWKMMGKEQYVRDMWEYFCQESARVKRFREEAEEERASRNTGSVAAGIASRSK